MASHPYPLALDATTNAYLHQLAARRGEPPAITLKALAVRIIHQERAALVSPKPPKALTPAQQTRKRHAAERKAARDAVTTAKMAINAAYDWMRPMQNAKMAGEPFNAQALGRAEAAYRKAQADLTAATAHVHALAQQHSRELGYDT